MFCITESCYNKIIINILYAQQVARLYIYANPHRVIELSEEMFNKITVKKRGCNFCETMCELRLTHEQKNAQN